MTKLFSLASVSLLSILFCTSNSFAASHEKTVASETDKIIESMTGDKKEVTEEMAKETVAEEQTSEEAPVAEEAKAEDTAADPVDAKKEEEEEEPDCD